MRMLVLLSNLFRALRRGGWCPEPPMMGQCSDVVPEKKSEMGVVGMMKGVLLSPDDVFDRMRSAPSYPPGIISMLIYICALMLPIVAFYNDPFSLLRRYVFLLISTSFLMMTAFWTVPAILWLVIAKSLGGRGGLKSTICGFWLTRLVKLPSLLLVHLRFYYFFSSIESCGIGSFEVVFHTLSLAYTQESPALVCLGDVGELLTSLWVAYLLWRLLMHTHRINKRRSLIAVTVLFAINLMSVPLKIFSGQSFTLLGGTAPGLLSLLF